MGVFSGDLLFWIFREPRYGLGGGKAIVQNRYWRMDVVRRARLPGIAA
jgi:hypothetical protein